MRERKSEVGSRKYPHKTKSLVSAANMLESGGFFVNKVSGWGIRNVECDHEIRERNAKGKATKGHKLRKMTMNPFAIFVTFRVFRNQILCLQSCTNEERNPSSDRLRKTANDIPKSEFRFHSFFICPQMAVSLPFGLTAVLISGRFPLTAAFISASLRILS
jgi:hypothetical protein